MRLAIALLAGTIVAGVAAAPAHALTFGPSGVCPVTAGLGPFGGGGTGNATDCNLFITFNADGSITTTNGPQTTYDSIEDALIGVINNTGHTISSFNIAGSGIFGFDGDGVNGYTGVTNAATGLSQPHGIGEDLYGGADAFYTSIVGNDSGVVNFLNPIAAGGGHDYFSLEQPININAPPVITAAPEPASLALLGVGLFGVALSRRRSR